MYIAFTKCEICGNCSKDSQSKCQKILQEHIDLQSDKSPVQPCKRDRTSGRTITLPAPTCEFGSCVCSSVCCEGTMSAFQNWNNSTLLIYLYISKNTLYMCISIHTYINNLIIHKQLKPCICQKDPNASFQLQSLLATLNSMKWVWTSDHSHEKKHGKGIYRFSWLPGPSGNQLNSSTWMGSKSLSHHSLQYSLWKGSSYCCQLGHHALSGPSAQTWSNGLKTSGNLDLRKLATRTREGLTLHAMRVAVSQDKGRQDDYIKKHIWCFRKSETSQVAFHTPLPD